MQTILITGANGFIGKNLIASLEKEQVKIIKYDLHNTLDDLNEYVKEADFVFHLAGVNRPNEVSEFEKGNKDFTEYLLDLIKKSPKTIPLLFTSSIQSELNNPYGISKKYAEDAVLEYSRETGAAVYIYRLPNVFGKWSLPNYNSVVSTWCYNISRNLPIQINNPDTELSLIYIDDVVREFILALHGSTSLDKGFCFVPRIFTVSLRKIANLLESFKNSRASLILPSFEGDFERFLYATYLSFLPESDFSYDLEMKHDNRGWLAEFIKSKSLGQIFISRTKPGITRGNHWHHTKIEKFLVIEGEAIIKFRHLHSTEVLEYRVSGEIIQVLDIPAGYTHSITNIGKTDLITIFWADETFSQENPDTYFLEV